MALTRGMLFDRDLVFGFADDRIRLRRPMSCRNVKHFADKLEACRYVRMPTAFKGSAKMPDAARLDSTSGGWSPFMTVSLLQLQYQTSVR